ncbi:translational GTPase TypA [Cardinium endosymbiont of Culicoides punctatus]|uniref:translational GTPase TypA n=1 Tax=Cardinium endosymbiont of Culicoides punctatus TaxID=2304601 RepID=UPI001058C6C9|nr:translational GTPase TypA [Cardinium endosymbiont of Culicoides punctatus]TDG95601.1 GTP-binding protein TypA/BipA [Cardinium endosymbiont of Culicoides punctatus]
MQPLRNIAIIAHVDHGKTTLLDNLLKQSGTFKAHQEVAERVMDSNDLEKERGITIVAKCTSLIWEDTRINIVDTPGHADFGGEVERILSMVDGVVLLVDAAEGTMPQTKFVLGKALKLGLRPIVLVNKIDRSDARPREVEDEILELFMALDATEEQLDFPIAYASGRSGWASRTLDGERKDLSPLFSLILEHVPTPKVDLTADFSMLISAREYDPYLGRMLTGRIFTGSLKVQQAVKVLNKDNGLVENGKIVKIMAFRGMERVPIEEAHAGDIVAIAGMQSANVADTICAPTLMQALPALPIDPPTLAINFSVNDSPLAGTEGKKVTFNAIRDRLMRELESNVSIQVTESERKDSFEVAGRGELQLGVLIETMRREGFELSISRPRVLIKQGTNGEKLEPLEEIQIEVDDEFTGAVIESMSLRKAEIKDMRPTGGGKTRITFIGPSRGLIGYYGNFLTETRGTGVMNRTFHSYSTYRGAISGRRNGVLISMGSGDAVAYALGNLTDRGKMFIAPGEKVYGGMIVGEHNRDNDLEVNILKGKQLTNMRASSSDETIRLSPPIVMTLEEAIAYIKDDERVEVTPQSIRLRKVFLDPNERKRAAKSQS